MKTLELIFLKGEGGLIPQCTLYSKLRSTEIYIKTFFNWDLLHARLNSHYEVLSYKKKQTKERNC